MAHLNKLAIRGIRSFDDKNISVMEFFSPVTVIVGHNGSGKTTIIECLKYATTGDQPPNTRGGAFIHDPKMANEKEVKAQVKLRFYAANGARMLAVRNLSVTMKKNGALTMKTLESILGLAENVEKGNGKVRLPSCMRVRRGEAQGRCREVSSLRSVRKWTRRSRICSVSRRQSWRMSYSVTRRSRTGPCRNLLHSRRNSTISLRPPSGSIRTKSHPFPHLCSV